MELSVLASGSSGNCFYVEENNTALLIDAGISAKQVVERLGTMRKNTDNISAIFITHEHSDHVKGADVLARHLNIPIFATKKTADNCFLCSDSSLIQHIKNNQTLKLGHMRINAFSKSHKCADPVSYSITSEKNKKLSIITDAGYSCKNIIKNVADSDFLCMESNHDLKMLAEGPYPYFLKQWIKSDIGHLSNLQASLCILEHAPSKLKHVVLSHLSEKNNTPELALSTFNNLIKERRDLSPKVTVSSRFIPTPLFKI